MYNTEYEPNHWRTTGEHTKEHERMGRKVQFRTRYSARSSRHFTVQFLHVSARLIAFPFSAAARGRHSLKLVGALPTQQQDQSNDEESCKEDHNEGSTSERMRRAPMATPRWIILSEQKLLLEEFFKAVP